MGAKTENMWIRKTESEINGEKKRGFWKCFLVYFVFMFCVAVFTEKTGWRKLSMMLPEVRSWEEVWRKSPFLLSFSFLLAFPMALWQVYVAGPATILCPKCGSAKVNDRKLDCKCGGRYENQDNFKYFHAKGQKRVGRGYEDGDEDKG
ncbi:MAG: hypothetical protein A2351_01265 [Omnitrophica bacterium RIFOXYB12_FULL_50_7]|nr:MAG: hypothetical protein A2351_01265 [Omnitrophica bacterium RIFOXYB12_FULL_50_7]